MGKEKVSKEKRKAITDARRWVTQIFELDSNEAETRKRVERIFEFVMGYDVFKNISRERVVNGPGTAEFVDFVIQPKPGPDVKPLAMVEIKRVRTKLSRKHLKQVTSYAIDAGCEWIILTNAREWRIYHVEFGQPPKTELYDAWNLLDDKTDVLVKKFDIISYKSIKRGALGKQWERVKALAPDKLLAAIVTLDTLGAIRRNLRKDTGILVDNDEVYAGITKLLNEAAGVTMSEIKIPIRPKRVKKEKTKKDKNASSTGGPVQ